MEIRWRSDGNWMGGMEKLNCKNIITPRMILRLILLSIPIQAFYYQPHLSRSYTSSPALNFSPHFNPHINQYINQHAPKSDVTSLFSTPTDNQIAPANSIEEAIKPLQDIGVDILGVEANEVIGE